jgi:hypothetical protein
MKEEIVISGISGRFPESNSTEEFWDNLINGVDMVTTDDRRWPIGKCTIDRASICRNIPVYLIMKEKDVMKSEKTCE